ncbi:MAG: hypothetical protein IPK16_17345 [Anaerolineales bacterium]|nr:hypothetical protein [Anaerolineales bacterium]
MEESNRLGTRYFDLFKSIVAIALLTVFVVTLLQGRALLYELQSRAVTVLNSPQSAPGELNTLLSGRGLPGATIEVLAGETQVGTTVIGADGTWSLPVPLPPGDVQLRARTIDAAGATLSESEVVTWNVPAPAPSASTATPLTMTGPQIGADGVVTLAGVGEPGATVELLAGDVALGAAPIGADGAWSLSARLEPGDYQLVVREVDAAGTVLTQRPDWRLQYRRRRLKLRRR